MTRNNLPLNSLSGRNSTRSTQQHTAVSFCFLGLLVLIGVVASPAEGGQLRHRNTTGSLSCESRCGELGTHEEASTLVVLGTSKASTGCGQGSASAEVSISGNESEIRLSARSDVHQSSSDPDHFQRLGLNAVTEWEVAPEPGDCPTYQVWLDWQFRDPGIRISVLGQRTFEVYRGQGSEFATSVTAGSPVKLIASEEVASSEAGFDSSDVSATLHLKQQPSAAFAPSVRSGDSPLEVTFTSFYCGPIDQWAWDFGNGQSFGGPNPPPITYTTEDCDDFTSGLTISWPEGTHKANSYNIHVENPTFEAAFSYSQDDLADPTLAFADDSGGSGFDQSWNFGDGTGWIHAVNPTHIFEVEEFETKEFDVTYLLRKNSGSCFREKIVTVPVHNYPTRIKAIEVTQAIQELQTIAEFKNDLQGDREPPVPIVSGKIAVMRVYFEKIPEVRKVPMEVWIAGKFEPRLHTLMPNCDDKDQRRGKCNSADFYFVPPAGPWSATVRVLDPTESEDESDEEIEHHTFEIQSRTASPITLSAVKVCDFQDEAGWHCADDYLKRLSELARLTEKIAPTHRVRVIDSGHQVLRDTRTSHLWDADNNGILDIDDWWEIVVRKIEDYYTLDNPHRFPGLDIRRYYGMTRPFIPGTTLGAALHRAAASRTVATFLGKPHSEATVAHETFHTMGLPHTNNDKPETSCRLPRTLGKNYPYPDNLIRTGNEDKNQLEVGFDTMALTPILPTTHHDPMSYCVDPWITGYTYTRLLEGAPASSVGTPNHNVPGNFWLLSGTLSEGAALLRPLFEFTTVGPIDEGQGEYRIEVRDDNGEVLFLRRFVPTRPSGLAPGDQIEVVGLPSFSEMIPMQPDAVEIRVLDPEANILTSVPLTGAPPTVELSFPSGGELLSGVQRLAWTVTDPDSLQHTFWIQYSPSSGEPGTWRNLAILNNEPSLTIDFDRLPGSDGTALVRVLASDEVNTGSSQSGLFIVPDKLPSAQILFPEDNTVYNATEMVWLQGFAFDPDDGVLEETSVTWESDLDGHLGHGLDLPLSGLTPGTHNITLRAKDSHGNIATADVSVVVAGAKPQLDLAVVALDSLPTRCVQVTLDAHPGSVELTNVEYSLDGGHSYTDVHLSDLPLHFIVPGSGASHLVARAYDVADQFAAADERFFINSPCPNIPPHADAGTDQVVECSSPEGTLVTLDGTASTDPDSDALAYQWTDVNGDVVATTAVTEVSLLQGSFDFTLTVKDGNGGVDSDSIAIIVGDNTPPNIKNATANPQTLWPPNHKMAPVTVSATALDICDAEPVCAVSAVTSSELVRGPGDVTQPDWTITGPLSVELRAERTHERQDRIYSIHLTCSDASGNVADATPKVVVPHDLGN